MKNKTYLILAFTLFLFAKVSAQPEGSPYVKDALKENRRLVYRNTINNIINKSLSLQLTDSTEEYWQDAFYALELIHYRSLWIDGKIKMAFDSIEKRSIKFQRSLLELAFANYKGKFYRAADMLMQRTKDPKVFAIAAEYYLAAKGDSASWNKVVQYFTRRPDKSKNVPAYYGLLSKLIPGYSEKDPSFISNLKNVAPGHTLLISFQRKNRDYPGIVVIRNASGSFVKDGTGNIFSVPQLARSTNNLPFYLPNGNTPQGIFKMNGFDVSKSMAIGPTTNIQLLMPYETGPQYFLNNAGIADTVWSEEVYKQLLPESLKEYLPLYESFYASKSGRSEIISHGTTVNPEYYKNLPYYPLTPTQGCLCTKEIWSEVDGKRIESDQQKLVNALKTAGGANGYVLVVELDDKQQPVKLQEIMPYLKRQ